MSISTSDIDILKRENDQLRAVISKFKDVVTGENGLIKNNEKLLSRISTLEAEYTNLLQSSSIERVHLLMNEIIQLAVKDMGDLETLELGLPEKSKIRSVLITFNAILRGCHKKAQSHINSAEALLAQGENACTPGSNVERALVHCNQALLLKPDDKRAASLLKRAQIIIRNRESLPGIFISTLPKSGTTFILDCFQRGLNIQRILTSTDVGDIEQEQVLHWKLQQLASEGGKIAIEHLPATGININLLNTYLDRWVVHVRDPRQNLISMVHHFSAMIKENAFSTHHKKLFVEDFLKTYASLSLSEQVSYHMKEYLPKAISFINNWVEAKDNPLYSSKILLTQHEILKEDNNAFLESILNFYSIDKSMFCFPNKKPEKGELHFREGRTDEWREVLTPTQAKKATDMIPEKLFKRFNWPKY